MTTLTQPPTLINESNNVDLTADQIMTGPNGGYVIAQPNFDGYILTLTGGLTEGSTFSTDLYAQLSNTFFEGGAVSVPFAYPVTFSCGNGNTFILTTDDGNLNTDDSTTFSYNEGIIDSSWQPTILFVYTGISESETNYRLFSVYY